MKDRNDLDLIIRIGDLLSDGIVLFDLNNQHIVYINAAATAMTGINPADGFEQITRVWKQVMVQDRAYVISQLRDILSKPVSGSAEFGLWRDGKIEKHLHITGCVITDRSLLVVFVRDITHTKQHEDYLVEFGIKKNTLLDTLTHNLSGSLNLTKHLARQAEKHADQSDKELQTFLELITGNTSSSLQVIEDFVVFEYEKSPRIHTKTTRIDLVEKIGFIHEQLQSSYTDRQFQLHSDKPELHVTTDEVKLLQIMNNLTANALKFSPPESPIIIRIRAEEQQAVISVEDRGIGIPASLKSLMFLRQPTTGRPGLNGEPSNGQGLWICKSLVELLGGSIWFESIENAGTTFYISIPYALNTHENQTGMVEQ